MSQSYSFEIYDFLNDEILEEWKKNLVEFENYYFQDINFLKNYINSEVFKEKNNSKLKLVFIKCNYSKNLIYIFPFEIVNLFGIKILQWLGNDHFDYCSPIINTKLSKNINFKELWNNLLRKIGEIDLIYLTKQPKKINNLDNPFIEFFSVDDYSRINLIRLKENYLTYISDLHNKKFLNDFLRTKKKLYSYYDVEIKVLDKKDNSLLPSEIISSKTRELSIRKSKTNLNEKLGFFYDSLYKNEIFTLIAVLNINKELVASSYNFIYKNRFYYFMPIIFSKKYNQYSPGKILIDHLIEFAYKKKLNYFDFGLGDEKYKKYWSNQILHLFKFMEFKSLKGLIILLLLKIFFFFKKIRRL